MLARSVHRFRVSEQTARSFAERLLTHAVQRPGAEYLNEMAARIELAFKLRDQAATILEQVIGPEALSPDEAAANLDAAFRDIKSNIYAITDPSTFAKARAKDQASGIEIEFLPPEERAREEQLKAEPARKGARAGRHVEQIKVLSRVFEAMAVGEQHGVDGLDQIPSIRRIAAPGGDFGAGGSGSAQQVLRSPARAPTRVPLRRRRVAAPPGETRSSFCQAKNAVGYQE